MGIKCSYRHTFAPIDSAFCTPGIYIQFSRGPREARNNYWSQSTQSGGPTPSTPYRPVHLLSRLVEAQLPPIGEEDKLLPPLYPGMVTIGPGRKLDSSIPLCAPPWGQVFLKNPGVHGAIDFKSFSGVLCLPLPHFQPHKVVCYCSCFYLLRLGLTPNTAIPGYCYCSRLLK